ncbi:YwaF family protein [Brachybacterium hainanense]|uniref:TIGR02206 family membrane protein n=1 Tax=Brachybacterium hainanense TaxID=1541174 RepID=A0ABV6RAF4_9MICO
MPGSMPAYGLQHLSALAVIAVLAAACLVLARRHRGTPGLERSVRAAGWLILLVSATWTLWALLPANWDVDQSLPLHYSDALRYVTAIALIRRPSWAVDICYFWGLTLNTQSLLTPDLVYLSHPALEFAEYWFAHGTALIAPIVLVWGMGHRPTWRGFAVAYGAALAWAGLALGVNAATGANYGYLSRAPEGASLLDVLGPWPWYVVSEAVLAAAVWALMTLPWTLRRAARSRRAPADRARP